MDGGSGARHFQMIYFTPRFRLATLSAPQQKLCSKIGGAPWGLPVDLWPRCCGGYLQKRVAQFLHQPPMLDLGDPNAVLHLFQCPKCGGTSDDDIGRGVLILDRKVLGDELSTPDGYDDAIDRGRPLIGEAFLEGFDQHDDGISESRLPDFFDEERLWQLQDEHPRVDWFDPKSDNKFGGSPRWTGNGPRIYFGPGEFEWPNSQFLFQLGESIWMPGEAPHPDDVGCQLFLNDLNRHQRMIKPSPGKEKKNAPFSIGVSEGSEGWWFDFINLGTDGTLFVFAERATKPLRVRWFWNR